MPDSPWPTLLGFPLVLARVSGLLGFIPLPGIRSAADPVRAALALSITVALYPRWPALDLAGAGVGRLACWVAAEAALGIAMGVFVTMVMEVFTLAAQVLGLQAGYAYASTIDPTTQADSGVLLVVAQLFAGMLFFAMGLDREVIMLVALSLERIPPGSYALNRAWSETVIRMGDGMFAMGLRLAFPVVALLLMVDVALALLGRLNAHLQLLSLAFPAKMLAALALLALVVAVFPRLLRQWSGANWRALEQLLGT
jgi:flagellar biosynthesis protein FliR